MPISRRNVKLVVQYDGRNFSGWQQQKNCVTVQGELTRAIEDVVCHPVEVQGAGRTDRGVHALGQAANFFTERDIPTRNLVLAINTKLPADIAVVEAADVGEEFNARFSALGKHYRYTFYESETRDVFASRWTSRHSETVDIEAMRRAAVHLLGERDFVALRTRSKQEPESTVRRVYGVEIRREGPYILVDVVGSSFLYKMVRAIAGTLFEVGVGKRDPDSLLDLLEAGDRGLAGPTAEAQGLCLMAVFFEEAELRERLKLLSSNGFGLSASKSLLPPGFETRQND